MKKTLEVLALLLAWSIGEPAKLPYVSHVRGAEPVTEHNERNVCPTITSSDLLGGPALRLREDKRPHVAVIVSEDEYDAPKTLPAFAQVLRERYGCYCTIATSPAKSTGISGLDELRTADVAVLFVRRRVLPKEQLDKIRAYLDAGKPLVALRTASHAFAALRNAPAVAGTDQWPQFDHEVLGGNYHGHGRKPTDVRIAPGAAAEPILSGIEPSQWTSPGTLYFTSPIDEHARVLLIGSSEGKSEPVAWTRSYKGGRVFYTSLGHPDDFAAPQFQRLLVNAIQWAIGRALPGALVK